MAAISVVGQGSVVVSGEMCEQWARCVIIMSPSTYYHAAQKGDNYVQTYHYCFYTQLCARIMVGIGGRPAGFVVLLHISLWSVANSPISRL